MKLKNIILISILIKLFDPGPIIFKQKRVGMNNKPFYMYKFRSMPVDTKNIASDKINKLNLNFISKFIRRTNIDELPQLFNILKSDISIVGPRPALFSQNYLIEILCIALFYILINLSLKFFTRKQFFF